MPILLFAFALELFDRRQDANLKIEAWQQHLCDILGHDDLYSITEGIEWKLMDD